MQLESAKAFRLEAAAKGLINRTYQVGSTVFLFDLKHGHLWVPADRSKVEELVELARTHADESYSEAGEMIRLIARRSDLALACEGVSVEVYWHWPHHITCPTGDAGISLDEWLNEGRYRPHSGTTRTMSEEDRMLTFIHEAWHASDYERYRNVDKT